LVNLKRFGLNTSFWSNRHFEYSFYGTIAMLYERGLRSLLNPG